MYGAQTLLFSQEFMVPKQTIKEAKKPKTKKKETGILSNFDTKVDAFVAETGKVMAEMVGADKVNPLVVALILFPLFGVGVYFIGLALRILIIRPLLALWARKAEKDQDKDTIQNIRKHLTPFFITLGLRIGIVPLEAYFNQKIAFLRNPLNAILIFTAALIFQKILVASISVWGQRLAKKTESTLDDQLVPILLGLVKTMVVIFGTLFAISALGVNMGPLLASLGAASFALGFAVKDSLSNFVAGIFLIVENTFEVGDKVEIPGIGLGYIHEIGLRTTKLRTFDHEVIVIPNNTLMNKEYRNYRLPTLKIRVVVSFGVAYGSDVNKVRDIAWKVLAEIDGKLDDPAPAVEFNNMGDFSLDFAIKFYVDNFADQYSKKLEVTDKIYHSLVAEGIEIPYPTYTLDMLKKGD